MNKILNSMNLMKISFMPQISQELEKIKKQPKFLNQKEELTKQLFNDVFLIQYTELTTKVRNPGESYL